MGSLIWMVCLCVSINAMQIQDPLQLIRQEIIEMRNEYLTKVQEQDRKIEAQERKIEEQDRKIEQLEGKVNSDKINRGGQTLQTFMECFVKK